METASDIIDGLARARAFFDPKTTSLMLPGRGEFNVSSEPFRAGFLDGIEERATLARLLRILDERSQKLMLLWYVQAQPVTDIARRLSVSRVHCYRMKNKALSRMVGILRAERDAANEQVA